ncbi:g791 [Coccomyxa viridis]|uniref:G791 protein n=1 Tax=Coccomyxa viridis TaxID=1274662 RepID=A0ABP1FND2_9CHLO
MSLALPRRVDRAVLCRGSDDLRRRSRFSFRYRKSLVSLGLRKLLEKADRAVHKAQPAIQAVAQAEQQIAFAAISKLKNAINFRQWTARGKGLVLLNILVVLCASNWVVVKDCEGSFDPYIFALLRFTVAAAAFSPFFKKALANKKIWRGGLELGLWMGLGYLTQAEGLITTDASRASFISTFTVLVVPLLAGATGKADVKPLTYVSALMALAGVALLVEKGGVIMPNSGDAWSFASAVFFGIQVFRTEIISRRLNKSATLPLMSAALTTVASIMAIAAAATHPKEVEHLMQLPAQIHRMVQDGIPWWQIVYTGIMSTDAVLMIEVVALHDVSSTDAAIIYTMEPVLGAAFAYALLGERWGSLGWAGAGLIVVSSLAAQILGTENQKELPAPKKR